jgi:ATP-dependent Zn protease
VSRRKKERERKERVRQYKAGVKPYDLTRLTAFHEAGHVVFSTLHDNEVEIVTVDPQKVEELTGRKGCPGYTRYTKEGYGDADTVFMMTAVGLTSEALLVSGGVINPQEDDLRLIHDMLENQLGLHGEAENRELFRIRHLTQQFVEDHRTAITSVAEALIERKTLTGEDVNQILKR